MRRKSEGTRRITKSLNRRGEVTLPLGKKGNISKRFISGEGSLDIHDRATVGRAPWINRVKVGAAYQLEEGKGERERGKSDGSGNKVLP